MSLATIDAALLAALAVLGHTGTASDAQPFALVARHTGPWTREALQHVVGQYPACLLRPNGAAYGLSGDTILGDGEVRAPEGWSVLVALEDPRSADDALQGVSGAPGLLTLIDLALSRVNLLPVAGTDVERYARASGWRWVPELVRDGTVTAAEILLVVDRIPPSVAQLAPGEPFERADGETHVPDGPAVPMHVALDD